jgi:hypothetical protein
LILISELLEQSQTWNCNQSCNVTSPVHLKQQILKDFGLSAGTESSIAAETVNDVELMIRKRFMRRQKDEQELLLLGLFNC